MGGTHGGRGWTGQAVAAERAGGRVRERWAQPAAASARPPCRLPTPSHQHCAPHQSMAAPKVYAAVARACAVLASARGRAGGPGACWCTSLAHLAVRLPNGQHISATGAVRMGRRLRTDIRGPSPARKASPWRADQHCQHSAVLSGVRRPAQVVPCGSSLGLLAYISQPWYCWQGSGFTLQLLRRLHRCPGPLMGRRQQLARCWQDHRWQRAAAGLPPSYVVGSIVGIGVVVLWGYARLA